MQPGTFIAGAAAVAAFGMLGFRVLDLEQRVARLSEQQTVPAASDSGAPITRKTYVTEGGNCEQRLANLEKKVAALSAAEHTREKLAAAEGSRPADDEILSVVEREGNRVRDVQLEWNKQRWLEARESELTAFAINQHLNPEQTDKLRQILQNEIDKMVDVLKRPHLWDDPDQLASDWQALLDDTDQQARGVLNTYQQNTAWTQARQFERQWLWPWLPKQQSAMTRANQ